MRKVVIAGGGPAGLTAAIYLARSGMNPLVYTGLQPGGQLALTGGVENYPGYAQTIRGSELMEKMRMQAEKFGAEFKSGTLADAVFQNGKAHKLTMTNGETLECEKLIIATGAQPRRLGLPSETKLWGKGISSCATCDGPLYKNVPIAVIGGGDSAMEESTYLARFTSEIHLIHRRGSFNASRIMVDRALSEPKIKIHWDTEVIDFLGEDELSGLVLRDILSGRTSTLPCKGCFLAIGYEPATGVFRGKLEFDTHGFIRTFEGTTETSRKGVFACGDCADGYYRQAVTAAGSGCAAAIDVVRS